MTDVILVAAGTLPQAVLGVVRNSDDPDVFGAAAAGLQVFVVDGALNVCADQLWDGAAASDPVSTPSEAELLALVEAGISARQQASFAYDFGASVATSDDGSEAAAETKHIQMRDTARNPDQNNWTRLVGILQIALMAGLATTQTEQVIRVEENVNVATTIGGFFTAITQAGVRNQTILFTGIALKAAIRAAETDEAKLAVWTNSGWAD